MYNSKIREICYAYALANKMALPLSVEDTFNAVALWVEDTVTGMAPYIGSNNHWYVYDKTTQTFKDSGVEATEAGPAGATGPQGAQGPQGPQGHMPPLVSTRGNSTSDAISQQGIENIFYNSQITLGANATAGGTDAVAIGYSATSNGENTTALGCRAYANNNGSIALGKSATASGYSSIAIGQGAKAESHYATSLGYGAEAKEVHTIAIGYQALAKNGYSIAIGRSATVTGTESTAIGIKCTVNGNNSILIGTEANCETDNTFQVGNYPLLDLTTGLIPSERIQGGRAGGPRGITNLYVHILDCSMNERDHAYFEIYSSVSTPCENISQVKSLLADATSTEFISASGYVSLEAAGSPIRKLYPVYRVMISDMMYFYYIDEDHHEATVQSSSVSVVDRVRQIIHN